MKRKISKSRTKGSNGSRSNSAGCGIVLLAAGQGKRMHTDLPKVLNPLAGRVLIFHILDAIAELAKEVGKISVAVVVGHRREDVETVVGAYEKEHPELDIDFIHQAERKGTGDAAKVAIKSDWGQRQVDARSNVLVLPGDQPLISKNLLQQMTAPLKPGSKMRLLTCEMADPFGYGRIVRKGRGGAVQRIVEEKDASPKERKITEIANSIYLFDAGFLNIGVDKLKTGNAQGEYYLTDLVSFANAGTSRSKKPSVDVLQWENSQELTGINNLWELSCVGKLVNQACLKKWALLGVRFKDPESVWIDSTVTLAKEVIIHPGVVLSGSTSIGAGAVIGKSVNLLNVQVEGNAVVKTGTVAEDSIIRRGARVGPYAHLRPGSEVGVDAKVGNFVELKQAKIGRKTSVAHLSYVGDAVVGDHVNIGCGFITCNFDGRVIDGKRKHETVIEDDVFIGSDCQLVAPIKIEKGSYIASGSTVTKNVASGDLAIARSRQVNKKGYAARLKGGVGLPAKTGLKSGEV